MALLEQDEATAVRDVRQAREGMKRAKKNALKILEGFFGLAELDDLEDKLRWREPAARGAEESVPAETAAAGKEVRVDENQPPAVAESTEVPQPEPQPSVAGAGEVHALRGEPRLVTSDEPDAETATTGVWDLASTSRVGSEDTPPLEVAASAESPETPEPPVPTHPVRKVLQWLSAVPHRGQMPENGASPVTSREEAA